MPGALDALMLVAALVAVLCFGLADLLAGAAFELTGRGSVKRSDGVTCSVAGFLIGSDTAGSAVFTLLLTAVFGAGRLTGSGSTSGMGWGLD